MSEKQLNNGHSSKNRTDRIMNIVAKKAGFYRCHPHRFVEEVLEIRLKLFQKILIYAMMTHDCFFYIAARGQGKTFLVALFCCVRCILYPGTKIIVSSYTFKQAKETILKITDDFMHKSSILRSEILKTSTGQNDAGVWFKNGSWVQVRVAAESSRGARANVLIVDESRMVSDHILQTVLIPMLNASRSPGYLNNPKYAHLQEMNKQLYMSSAWYKQSEMYEMVKTYLATMLEEGSKFYICDLPYQVSLAAGILMRELVENEMMKQNFNDISFMMEYEGKFYGSGEDSLFNFKVLNDRRILKDSLHNLDFYRDNNIKIPSKKIGSKRILAADIALLASKKHDNDASAISILDAVLTSSNDYITNLSYLETQEGLVTEELGLLIMRYYYQYNCDYIALDANGVGQAVLDFLMQDRYDPMYGCTYGALNCCNNDDLAQRCKVRNAPKVIYAFKASAKSNNDMCLSLRAGFQNGNINLLAVENDIEEYLVQSIKGYKKLSDMQQAKLKAPYLQTSFLIDELINLDHEISNGLIKVKEKSGMRKDRYSSLLYGYATIQDLALKLKPKKQNLLNNYNQVFKARPPKRMTRFS